MVRVFHRDGTDMAGPIVGSNYNAWTKERRKCCFPWRIAACSELGGAHRSRNTMPMTRPAPVMHLEVV